MPSNWGGSSKSLRDRPFFHFSSRHKPQVSLSRETEVPKRLPITREPAANLQGTTREFKYTSSIVYPSALTVLAMLGSFSCKACAFLHSSGMPSFREQTGGSPE